MTHRLIRVPTGAVALVVVNPSDGLEASIHGEHLSARDEGCTTWYIDMRSPDDGQSL